MQLTAHLCSSSTHFNYKRETEARIRRDYILLALRILETATTGPITNWIKDRLKTDMENISISKRGVQFILPKLEGEGLVSKNNIMNTA